MDGWSWGPKDEGLSTLDPDCLFVNDRSKKFQGVGRGSAAPTADGQEEVKGKRQQRRPTKERSGQRSSAKGQGSGKGIKETRMRQRAGAETRLAANEGGRSGRGKR